MMPHMMMGAIQASVPQPQNNNNNTFPENPNDAARNLLVNYLPPSVDEAGLRELFQMKGQVEKVKLIVEPSTRQSKCYGFVMYRTPEEALRAIKELSGYEVQGKRLRVTYAQANMVPGGVSPNMNVFFSDFEDLLTEVEIRTLAARYGGVQECKVLEYEKHPRGVAFIRYNTVAEAEDCVTGLNGQQISTAEKTVKLVVKYAERKKVKQSMLEKQKQRNVIVSSHYGEGGTYITNATLSNRVFIRGVTGRTERDVIDVVYALLAGFAPNISKVDVPSGPDGTPRNFCFVHYTDPLDAQCALRLNGRILNGKALQVRYK